MKDFNEFYEFMDEQQKKLQSLIDGIMYCDPYEVIDNIELTTIADLMYEPKVPACCKDPDCYVEPDGYCKHGNPSILLELDLI